MSELLNFPNFKMTVIYSNFDSRYFGIEKRYQLRRTICKDYDQINLHDILLANNIQKLNFLTNFDLNATGQSPDSAKKYYH